jgi:hypothetical protein
MSREGICGQVRERLLLRRGAARSEEVAAHLAECASCRAEAAFDELLGRAVSEMPAPAADVAAAVLRRIRSRPSLATVVVQVAVLLVLGLSLGTLLPGQSLVPEWPLAGRLASVSAEALSWLHSGTEAVGSLADSVVTGSAPPLGLAILGLAGLIGLNLRFAWRPAAEGGRR